MLEEQGARRRAAEARRAPEALRGAPGRASQAACGLGPGERTASCASGQQWPNDTIAFLLALERTVVNVDPTARFSTLCIHAGQEPDEATGAIITPLYQTSTYVQEGLGRHKGHEYARTSNPTRSAVEANIAALEGGTTGFGWASGMAAINAVLTLLEPGDHVVVTDNTYGGTYRLFERVLRKGGLDFTYVDTSDVEATVAAFTDRTRMLFLETPTNPVLRLADIAALSAAAHARGDITVVVDNTFASPAVQQPTPARRRHRAPQHDQVPERALGQRRRDGRRQARGPRRMAEVLPERGRRDPERVRLLADPARHQDPGRPHGGAQPQRPGDRRVPRPASEDRSRSTTPACRRIRSTPSRSSRCGGTRAWCRSTSGTLERARGVLERVRLFALAESLGGVESLISHPASMTHASVPAERRAALGVTDSLIRVSVGIEDIDDLKADLEQALSAALTAFVFGLRPSLLRRPKATSTTGAA